MEKERVQTKDRANQLQMDRYKQDHKQAEQATKIKVGTKSRELDLKTAQNVESIAQLVKEQELRRQEWK